MKFENFDKFRQRHAIFSFQIKKRERGTTLRSFFRLQEDLERKICSSIVIRIVSKNGLRPVQKFLWKI